MTNQHGEHNPENWLTATCPKCNSTNTTLSIGYDNIASCGDCGAEVWF